MKIVILKLLNIFFHSLKNTSFVHGAWPHGPKTIELQFNLDGKIKNDRFS
jgi:hypothetical protein